MERGVDLVFHGRTKLVFHDSPPPRTNLCDESEDEKLWVYYPGEFRDIDLKDVLEECSELLSNYRNYNGETAKHISRKSCVFTADEKIAKKHLPSYQDVLFYRWDRSPITVVIKDRLEIICGHEFDYALFHCYEDGSASIAYHNDKESLDGEIASASVGVPRKFRIREMDQTRGFTAEYELGNGDVLIMKKGMQRQYKHSICKQLRIKEPRCNWTFRNFPE